MASFNVWGLNRAFLVKCRTPKLTTTANGANIVKTGALRVGIFEKGATGWAISNFNRNSIGFEPSELGKFLVDGRTSWNISKLERNLDSTGGGSAGGDSGADLLRKTLVINLNEKTEQVMVNLQVATKEGEELHNVSADLELGNWIGFKEVARASIPLLCGFDGATFRQISNV